MRTPTLPGALLLVSFATVACVRRDAPPSYPPPYAGPGAPGQGPPPGWQGGGAGPQATPWPNPSAPWTPPAQPAPWQPPQLGPWPVPGTSFPNLPGFPPLPGFGQPPAPTPAPTPSPDAAQRCVDGINSLRATQGLAPLARWLPSEACASGQAQDGYASGKAHGAFGRCGELAQNVCPGWPGPVESMLGSCLQSMWDEGPGSDYAKHGHYLNMTNRAYTKVACGSFTAPSGAVWAVQDFR